MNFDNGFRKENLLLYAITDRSWLNGRTLYEQVEQALQGGVTCLQLREKNLPRHEFLQEAKEIKKLCIPRHVPLIINDDVEVALEADADGVHVGQKDMDVPTVRKKLGKGKIIGVTAKTVEQALLAEMQGADYLGTGAVFGTNTKKDAIPISFEQLNQVCEAVRIPTVAIGGITIENISELSGSKISGVAVVSGIFAQEDITCAAEKLYARACSLFR